MITMSPNPHHYTVVATVLILAVTLCLNATPFPEQEIITEGFSWGVVYACAVVYLRFFPDVSQLSRPRISHSVSSFALCASLLCLSRSVRVMSWSMGPLLSPILFIIQSFYSVSTPLPKLEEPQPLSFLSNVNKTRALSYIVPAFAAVLVLIVDSPFDGFNLQLCWFFSQVGIYIILHSWTFEQDPNNSNNLSQILRIVSEIAPRVIGITGSLSLIWWQGTSIAPEAGMMIVLKAIRWLAVFTLATNLKISILPFVTVFGICTNAIHFSGNKFQIFLILIVAIATLYFITITVCQSRTAKIIVLLFSIFPLQSILTHEGVSLHLPTVRGNHHPIYYLAEEARAKFERTQKAQSQSLTDTVEEYVRRYRRQPPPGFDKWYNFAIENNVTLIDEYDLVSHSVDPYWGVTPKVLRDYIEKGINGHENMRLGVLEIEGHKAKEYDGGFQHNQLVQLLEPVAKYLPDMKVLLNGLDESRVVVPHEVLHPTSESSTSANATELYTAAGHTRPFSFINLDRKKTFETITESCPPDSPARSPPTLPDEKNDDIPFIKDVTQARDICQFSPELGDQHGFTSSPCSARITHERVPIASTAKISSFHDILIPSSYYFQGDISEYKDTWDIPWEEKKDIVYWRGSGTGGFWHDQSWHHGHRQRFVNFTNTAEQQIQLMHQKKPNGSYSTYGSVIGNMSGSFQVDFSKFLQCDEESCAEEEEKFHKVPADTLEDSYKYKILYNLDGNSFSGRYYRFLKSNSLVFMQNLFKEWHEDRLIAWVHYVPISLGMEELPETARYLLHDPEGQQIATRIAADSRDWARRTLRPVDLSAALFRSLLEYHRILQDDRDTTGCCEGGSAV